MFLCNCRDSLNHCCGEKRENVSSPHRPNQSKVSFLDSDCHPFSQCSSLSLAQAPCCFSPALLYVLISPLQRLGEKERQRQIAPLPASPHALPNNEIFFSFFFRIRQIASLFSRKDGLGICLLF